MYLDYLDNYIWALEALANDLLDFYSYKERVALFEKACEDWDVLQPLFETIPNSAYTFLSEGPSKQEKRLAKLDEPHRFHFWLQTRLLAHRSATELRRAREIVDVKGLKHREAFRRVAQKTELAVGPLTLEALLFDQLP